VAFSKARPARHGTLCC